MYLLFLDVSKIAVDYFTDFSVWFRISLSSFSGDTKEKKDSK